jgi:hypothetical protein
VRKNKHQNRQDKSNKKDHCIFSPNPAELGDGQASVYFTLQLGLPSSGKMVQPKKLLQREPFGTLIRCLSRVLPG